MWLLNHMRSWLAMRMDWKPEGLHVLLTILDKSPKFHAHILSGFVICVLQPQQMQRNLATGAPNQAMLIQLKHPCCNSEAGATWISHIVAELNGRKQKVSHLVFGGSLMVNVFPADDKPPYPVGWEKMIARCSLKVLISRAW